MKKKLMLFSISFLLISGLGFAAGSKNVYRIGVFHSPTGVFHPAYATHSYDFYITRFVFETLLRYGPDGKLEPNLAKEWSASKDGTVFTFVLRDGIKFHDGTPLTAEDVKYSIEYVGFPDYKGARASFINAIKGVKEFKAGKTKDLKGIKVLDKNTIQITTEKTYSSGFLRFGINFEIFPKHIWEKVEVGKAQEATDLMRQPIGTGPFKMTEYVPDQYVTFTRFDDYWEGAPKLDKIILVKTNRDTAQAQLFRGEIDQIYPGSIRKTDADQFKAHGMVISGVPRNAYQYMTVNLTKKPFQDKRVRQAIAHALNRKGVVDNFLEGHGEVSHNPYPSTFWAHPEGMNEYKYSRDKALELFKTAGWNYDAGKNVMYLDGKPVRFQLKYSKGNVVREKCAVLFQQNLKDVGIKIDLKIMEFGVMYDEVKKSDYEIALVGQGSENDGDLSKFYYSDFIKPIGDNSGSNWIRYKNPEVDRLIDEGFRTLDQDKRQTLYRKIGLLLNEELPVIYIYHWPDNIVFTGKLKGRTIPPVAAYSYYYKANKWYFAD